MENSHEDICSLRERVARNEEKIVAADKALGLARDSVSKNNLASIANFVLSTLAVVIAWLHH